MEDVQSYLRRALSAFRTRNYPYAEDLFRQALRLDRGNALAEKGLKRAQERRAQDPRSATTCPRLLPGCASWILGALLRKRVR